MTAPTDRDRERWPFNVNDKVRVKLTVHGWDIFDASLRAIGLDPAPYRGSHREDAEGWSEWQLWDLMHTFGPELRMGPLPPFATTIELCSDSLAAARAEGEAAGFERGVRECAALCDNRAELHEDRAKALWEGKEFARRGDAICEAWEAENCAAAIRALLPTGETPHV